MTSQIISSLRSTPLARRALHAPASSHTSALRAYDHAIEARQPQTLPMPTKDGQTLGILIVDESGAAGRLIYLLHSVGCWTTRSASSGATALSLARSFLPSIVLIGMQLPDMNAYRLATQLRNQAGERPVRLIALTTEPLHSGRDQARQAGFERYLAQPVGALDLDQLLRSQLS